MKKPADSLSLKLRHADADLPTLITAQGPLHGHTVFLAMSGLGAAIVCVTKERGQAASYRLWSGPKAYCPPQTPQTVSDLSAAGQALDAVQLVGREPAMGQALKGRWSGRLACDGKGSPVITMTRRIASYITLVLIGESIGWRYEVHRAKTWYADAVVEQPFTPYGDAKLALHEALTVVFRVAQDACKVRDTHHRVALDKVWGATRVRRFAPDGTKPMAVVIGSGKTRQTVELRHLTEADVPAVPDLKAAAPELAERSRSLVTELEGVVVGSDQQQAHYLGRVYNLLRFVAAAVDADECKGAQGEEARRSFEDARVAWESALVPRKGRQQVLPIGSMRDVVEPLALSAARLVRTCKSSAKRRAELVSTPAKGKAPAPAKGKAPAPVTDTRSRTAAGLAAAREAKRTVLIYPAGEAPTRNPDVPQPGRRDTSLVTPPAPRAAKPKPTPAGVPAVSGDAKQQALMQGFLQAMQQLR